MPSMRTAAFAAAALCPLLATAAGHPPRYDSVESFIKSVQGEPTAGDLAKGYGELGGKGHKDWAGLVSTKDQELPQIVVLTQDPDGKYQAAVTVQTEGGGTGHYFVDEVHIAKSSVYVSSSWNWHGCGGGATHQFKLYNGQWRLIGVTIQRSNADVTTEGDQTYYDAGDSVNIDRNVLTGNVIVKFTPKDKKTKVENVHVAPEVLLFQDYEQSQGSLSQFDGYAGC